MDLISFLPRAVMQGIPLLYGSTGEILTEKSGNLNLGIPGIMYVGGISGVIGLYDVDERVVVGFVLLAGGEQQCRCGGQYNSYFVSHGMMSIECVYSSTPPYPGFCCIAGLESISSWQIGSTKR